MIIMLKEQEQIDKYINDEMTSSERIAFEKEMQNNKELAESVALNRDLAQFFKERNPILEQTLSSLGNEYFKEDVPVAVTVPEASSDTIPPPSSSKGFRWILPVFLLGLVGIGGFWFLNQNGGEPMQDANIMNASPVLSPEDAEQLIEEGMLEEGGGEADMIKNAADEDFLKDVDDNSKVKEPLFNIKGENEKSKKEKEKSKKKDKPIAKVDNKVFKQNRMLESLILENVRSGEESATIYSPSKGYTYRLNGKEINLKIKGSTNIESDLELVVYDNNPANFDKDFKILKSRINKANKDDEYKLSFNANVELPQGLYYYIIRTKDDEKVVYISKFYVRD